MILHPWSNLRKIQNLDRLPDRRVSKHQRRPEDVDPLRGAGQAQAIYKALGLYAQEESRIELYENYREMDYDAIISAVLDAFGEDGAQTDPERGRIVWCEANSTEVQRIVTRCLDRTQTDQKAFPTMRTLARDGDVFQHVAAAKGEGIISLKAYDPWQVARMEDDIGRLLGFAPADDRGNPSKDETHAVPYYKVAHFRLPSRDLTNIYGCESSFLWGARITWRMLQLMLDQVVVQRLLRRPDRVLTLVDTAGMSFDDANFFIDDLKRRMHREWHLNPDGGTFQSQGVPLDDAMDVVLPRGPNNGTEFNNFPATNQNDLLRDLDMMYNNLANGVGFPHGFMRGEGRYNPEQSLSRQHQPFAKRASRLQRSFLYELVRLCMIDMAYQGLDPTAEAHRFSLHMAPVSPILEMERHEVIQMKLDRLERALRLGNDNQFNQDFYVPFVLRTYGGFPDDVVNALYKGAEGAEADHAASSSAFAFEGNGKKNGSAPDRGALREAIERAEEGFKRVIPPAVSERSLNATSGLVLESSCSDERERLKPSRNLSIDEWTNSSAEKRKAAVSSALQNTTDPKTRIEAINNDDAFRLRERSRTTRATVMRNLVSSGKIFKK